MGDFWYSLDKVRSYNALFNFIILLRGYGKTYAFKKFAIREAIEKGKQFMYLRRTDIELNDAMNTFMDDVSKEFPGYDFRVRLNKLQYNIPDLENEGQYLQDWETLGHFAYLSNGRRKKSVSYSNVYYMCYDEFLLPPNEPRAKYLPDEVMIFLDFYETVARMRDVQVFFLSNAMSTVNPYFLHFGLLLPQQSKSGIRRIGDDIVVEYHSAAEYEAAKKQTRFGKMIAGTRFEEYALQNQFINENNDMIQKVKPEKAFYLFTLNLEGRKYGVFYDKTTGCYYVTGSVNEQCPMEYRYKVSSGKGWLIKTRKTNRVINMFVDSFEEGFVRFENQKIKQETMAFIERIL